MCWLSVTCFKQIKWKMRQMFLVTFSFCREQVNRHHSLIFSVRNGLVLGSVFNLSEIWESHVTQTVIWTVVPDPEWWHQPVLCRFPGVQLPGGQGGGQLLVPEEGVGREPPLQRLQPPHGRVQVRKSALGVTVMITMSSFHVRSVVQSWWIVTVMTHRGVQLLSFHEPFSDGANYHVITVLAPLYHWWYRWCWRVERGHLLFLHSSLWHVALVDLWPQLGHKFNRLKKTKTSEVTLVTS